MKRWDELNAKTGNSIFENGDNRGLKALLYSISAVERERVHSGQVVLRKHMILPMFQGLRLGMDQEELTEQETALYDRQIRVWGVDAQRRLSKAHILVSGMKGTVVEIFPTGNIFDGSSPGFELELEPQAKTCFEGSLELGFRPTSVPQRPRRWAGSVVSPIPQSSVGGGSSKSRLKHEYQNSYPCLVQCLELAKAPMSSS
ncbi:hypothetical protein GIB67_038791 [Kingdonia uniflora]|uniref:Uncharacterized protein n=1 Tax=Kingdonia uniflora TaxID=39325 RepID=A0A7J7M0M4_9MAGN|nr:hypothetical protein GIB67_038791 [Kingdonia uniflora]